MAETSRNQGFEAVATVPPAADDRTGNRITVDEIAADLGLGVRAVREMLENGTIPAVKLGRRWIITRHVYQEWLRNCGKTRVA